MFLMFSLMSQHRLAESKKDEGNKMYRMAKFFEAEKLYSEAIGELW